MKRFSIFLSRCVTHVRYGNGVKDRLNLAIVTLLISTPKELLRTNFPTTWFNTLAEMLAKQTTVRVGEILYRLNGCEAITVVAPESERWMWSYLKPKRGDVFIDIGAHIGKYALQVAKIVGEGGLVIAIEPSPENYHVLVRNVRLNDLRNTVALQIAAWEEKGQLQLFKSRYLTGQSLKRNHGLGSITVKTVSTDDIVDELRIRRVDWIKVDVEGAEYEVMKGLERTLMRFRPVVITEVFDDNRLRILRFMERVQYVATRANPGSEYPSYFLCLPIQLTVRRADSGVAVGFSFKEHARETFTKLRILN